MIVRQTAREQGLAEYLRTGKRKDSEYTREEKDLVLSLYGNLDIVEEAEEYTLKTKNWKSNYLHLTVSFTEEEFERAFRTENDDIDKGKMQELVEEILKFYTIGYDLENEVIAYAELHYPKIKEEQGKKRLPHIHIEISKLNALLDNQIQIPKFNIYINELFQTYLNKKYLLDLPVRYWKKEDKKTAREIAEKIAKKSLQEIEEELKAFIEKRKEYIEKRRSKKAKKLLAEIRKKSQEEIQAPETPKQIPSLKLPIDKEIKRPTSPLETSFKEILDEKKVDKELINKIKQKLRADIVLAYAKSKYKVDISKYEIVDNKIKKKNSKRKPKNVIDFLNKEIGLSIRDTFKIALALYQKQLEIEKKKQLERRKKKQDEAKAKTLKLVIAIIKALNLNKDKEKETIEFIENIQRDIEFKEFTEFLEEIGFRLFDFNKDIAEGFIEILDDIYKYEIIRKENEYVLKIKEEFKQEEDDEDVSIQIDLTPEWQKKNKGFGFNR